MKNIAKLIVFVLIFALSFKVWDVLLASQQYEIFAGHPGWRTALAALAAFGMVAGLLKWLAGRRKV